MPDLFLKAFRRWFDENEILLTQAGVKVTAWKETQDARNDIIHAEVATEEFLGDVSLWEYKENIALCDIHFGEIESGEFYWEHPEFSNPQELENVLNKFIMQISDKS